ncbi:hypothetical protein PybrP1_004426 [[Pythium] brassicae (nom. inval.)]|nr:hypothetical protein PybrP1_004426 [[Pythium] brassicae (nom. inval.)]
MNVDWPRMLATLLLIALAVACWRMARPADRAAPSATSAVTKSKKRAKKRAKKATTEAVLSAAPSAATLAPPAAAPAAEEDEDENDEDEDEGLSAAQVLARRKFNTTRALGTAKAAPPPPPQSAVPKFGVGQRVLAQFQGGAEWFPATVIEVRRGNEYNLRYDDGEDEFRVSHKLMKPLVAPAAERAAEPKATADDAAAAFPSSSDGGGDADESAADNDDADDDDGWEIVGGKAKGARAPGSGGASSAPPAGVGADGLTKRQRENRRKKERQREVKELARAQAQENGLHVRWGGTYSKMKYVPPPSQQP